MQLEVIENPNIALGGGAGIQAAQLIAEKGVTTVLTGNCGPNAFNVFGQAGIQVIVGVSGIVRNAVEQFKTQGFSYASGPNVDSHFGISDTPPNPTFAERPIPSIPGQGGSMAPNAGVNRGMGRGTGRGGGMGRNMGRGGGMGRGMGMAAPMGVPSSEPALSFPENTGADQELTELKQQANILKQQKKQLNQKINQLESTHKAVAVVDPDKCGCCGICMDLCPVNAIEIKRHAFINTNTCIACAACVSECPNAAIIIAQRKNR
jgi:predicted Fe-Mo cluster-binding NifX family protein/ferredoxin